MKKRWKLAAVVMAGGILLTRGSFLKNNTDTTKRVLVGIDAIYFAPEKAAAGEAGFDDASVENKGLGDWLFGSADDTGKDVLEGISSANAVLLDAADGGVLAGKKESARIYPASMTKIMTALVALEHFPDQDERTILTDDDFYGLYEQGASMAGFLPGEEISYRDLLYGILLPSGAECCLAAVHRIAGTEEAFVELMNEKAREIGMTETHFTNSTGLHDKDHYSTVSDMAKLLRYALQNPQFYEIFTSSYYSIAPTALHPSGVTFQSTVAQYLDTLEVNGGEILGGKTGYTDQAGLCLASMAQIDGRTYLLVTAGADGVPGYYANHLTDAISVYEKLA